jgi:hypothetical protein
MTHTVLRRTWLAGVAATAIAVLAPGVATAEPPSNDDFGTATAITALPFETTENTTEATTAPDDPTTCQSQYGNSVWFRYTAPADGLVKATVATPAYYPFLTAYTGERGDLTQVPGVCAFGRGNPETFHVTAGTTYHFLVASNYHDGGATTLRLEAAAPSPNDDIATAQRVPGLPTSVVGDLVRAGTESGEPTPSCDDTASQSIWYVYSPATPRWVDVTSYGNVITVYHGTPSPLSEMDCTHGSPAVFQADLGETYHVRVANSPENAERVGITFRTAPALRPNVYVSPTPATVLDDVLFFPYPGDELNRQIASGTLSFGDGTSTPLTGADPVQHRYTADGEYQLGLTVTTDDGRTGTGTSTLVVETHDVTVSTLTVPATARVGRTKPITVSITNTRYGETVEVELYKQNGDQLTSIGTLTQSVPAGRTVQFPFAYTFGPTDNDTVTFTAVATLQDYAWRDANPADNERTATTTVLP